MPNSARRRPVLLPLALLAGLVGFVSRVLPGLDVHTSAQTANSSTGLAFVPLHGLRRQRMGPLMTQRGQPSTSLGAGGESIEVVTNVVASAFPGAMSGRTLMPRVLEALEHYGVRPENSVYGQSLCSDEINSDAGHLNVLLSEHFGTAFHFGGLGGAPYAGKTGFAAFSAHAPDGGHTVLLFAPHVGVTSTGEIGRFERSGQAEASTSCGAAIAAYGQCKAGHPPGMDEHDLEQSWIRQRMRARIHDVDMSKDPMVELPYQMYKCIEEEVLSIVNTDFGRGHLVLIGGIQINMPYPMDGGFLPLHFSIRSADADPVNLLPGLASG